jgi:2-C-methyl-D-erythritol 4-phosphate cytidylyltransferase
VAPSGVPAVLVADLPECGAAPDVLAPLLGEPVLSRSVRGLLASGVVAHVLLLVRPDVADVAEKLLVDLPVTVLAGRRSLLAEAERLCAHVDQRPGTGPGDGGSGGSFLVHDAARPLTPPALAVAVTEAVAGGHAVAVPVLPLSDTVKDVDAAGLVVGSPDRTGLRIVQTPQAFRIELLERVLRVPVPPEQAWVVAGEPVVTVPGHPLAFPVRSPWDRSLAELLAATSAGEGA